MRRDLCSFLTVSWNTYIYINVRNVGPRVYSFCRTFAKLCGAPGFWENVLDSFFCLYIEIAYSNFAFCGAYAIIFLVRYTILTKRAHPQFFFSVRTSKYCLNILTFWCLTQTKEYSVQSTTKKFIQTTIKKYSPTSQKYWMIVKVNQDFLTTQKIFWSFCVVLWISF